MKVQKTKIYLLFCISVKLRLLYEGNNVDWRCLRKAVGAYLHHWKEKRCGLRKLQKRRYIIGF